MSAINTTLLSPSDQSKKNIPACSACIEACSLSKPAANWIIIPGYPFLITTPGKTPSEEQSTGIVGSAGPSLCPQRYFESTNHDVEAAMNRIREIRRSLRESWSKMDRSGPRAVSTTSEIAIQRVLKRTRHSGCTNTVCSSFSKAGSLASSLQSLKTGVLTVPRGVRDKSKVGKRYKGPIIDEMIETASNWEDAVAALRSAIGTDWPWGKVSVPPGMAPGTVLPTRPPEISLDAYTPTTMPGSHEKLESV